MFRHLALTKEFAEPSHRQYEILAGAITSGDGIFNHLRIAVAGQRARNTRERHLGGNKLFMCNVGVNSEYIFDVTDVRNVRGHPAFSFSQKNRTYAPIVRRWRQVVLGYLWLEALYDSLGLLAKRNRASAPERKEASMGAAKKIPPRWFKLGISFRLQGGQVLLQFSDSVKRVQMTGGGARKLAKSLPLESIGVSIYGRMKMTLLRWRRREIIASKFNGPAQALVKHSRFKMLVLVRLLLLRRLAPGVGFPLMVLLLLSFDFSVHTWNTSFTPIDTMRRTKGTIISIGLIDFFYCSRISSTQGH